MERFGVGFPALDPEVAASVGRVWRRYRQDRGTRDRLLPDLLIGTHAWLRADRSITRDRGFHRTYFERLKSSIRRCLDLGFPAFVAPGAAIANEQDPAGQGHGRGGEDQQAERQQERRLSIHASEGTGTDL
jgi:hypothetical protein